MLGAFENCGACVRDIKRGQFSPVIILPSLALPRPPSPSLALYLCKMSLTLESFMGEQTLPLNLKVGIIGRYLESQLTAHYRKHLKDVVLHPHSLMPQILKLQRRTDIFAALESVFEPYIGDGPEPIPRAHYGYNQCHEDIDTAFMHTAPADLNDHVSRLYYESETLNMEMHFMIQHVTLHSGKYCSYKLDASCRDITCRGTHSLSHPAGCLPVPHLALRPVWLSRTHGHRVTYLPRTDKKGPSVPTAYMKKEVLDEAIPIKTERSIRLLEEFWIAHTQDNGGHILDFMGCCDTPFPDTPADISLRLTDVERPHKCPMYCYRYN